MKLTLILLFLFLVGCASESYTITEGPELVEAMGFADTAPDTSPVTRGNIEQLVVRHGIVRVESVELAFSVRGFIYEIYVFPGDEVYEGQILARLDTEHTHEEIERMERNISDLIRNNEIADELFSLNMALRQLDSIELYEMERAELIHAQGTEVREQEIANAQRRLADLRESLHDTELRAPEAGTITYLVRHRGELIAPGAPIFFFNYSPYIFVEDTESVLAPHMQIVPRVRANINGISYELILREMTLHEAAAAAQQNTPNRWRYEIILPPNEAPPPLGAYASLIYYTVFVEDTLRAPSNAIMFTRDHGNFVYIKENDQFVRTLVQTGAISDSFTEILFGVEEGDVLRVH
ncbi:MAG: efflux RND transporter periplasmic adaptor subunit [Defluviitaleaceae bacterium]|nr:efflux RND transporter periplasmic adaptor subunit [Defluviitaleaceae bacterium]